MVICLNSSSSGISMWCGDEIIINIIIMVNIMIIIHGIDIGVDVRCWHYFYTNIRSSCSSSRSDIGNVLLISR